MMAFDAPEEKTLWKHCRKRIFKAQAYVGKINIYKKVTNEIEVVTESKSVANMLSLLYDTILTFIEPKKEAFWKQYGKRWKNGNQPCLLFPKCYLLSPKHSVTFISSSAKAFNLGKSKISQLGKVS